MIPQTLSQGEDIVRSAWKHAELGRNDLAPRKWSNNSYHKQVAIFRRNVFGFECGTLCGQSQFMRGKKLPAHMGFGIIELWVARKGGIERLRHEFFPFYD